MPYRNAGSLTEKKQHPWKDEKTSHENAISRRSNPLPPLASVPQRQVQRQTRGNSVRVVNYAAKSSRSGSARRRPRVGIFRATSQSPTEDSANNESNLDSLELALQDTSKESSSTRSTSSNSRSPGRSPHRPTNTGIKPVETFEDELAYIQQHQQSESPKTRSPKYGKFSQLMASPAPTWPASGWSPVSVSVSSPTSSNPFDQVEDSERGTPYEAASPSPQKSADANNNTSQTSDSNTSDDDQRFQDPLGLHKLCQEATRPDDISWRNALYLLGMQPELAQKVDPQGRTALHVACTGHATDDHPPQPPPDYMIRALLIAYPAAIQHREADSRLPIHCIAATSGDVGSLQLLMEAHPASMVARDAMGWTPLHLFLQNPHIHMTVPPIQTLLGMTLPLRAESHEPQEPIRQRRGDHLRLNVEHLDSMRSKQKDLPRWQPMQRFNIPEEILNAYPEDVRVCLMRLAQWERKEHRRQQKEQNETNKEVSFLSSSSSKTQAFQEQERNPAAMVAPQYRQLPLHITILRGLIDVQLQSSRIDEPPPSRRRSSKHKRDPDATAVQQTRQHTLIVIVRLLISVYPESLIGRDINGHTPLLLAMVAASDVLPSQELLELLLGKRTAGYDSMPSWAQDVPYPIQHAYAPASQRRLAPAAERYCNPAIVSTLDSCQLPLHIAAEEWGDHSSLIVAIYESYPGAIHVQDARGRMPLHILLHNYRRITPHPEIVAMLLSDRVARTFTDEGQLPFDLLVDAAPYLPRDPIPATVLDTGTVVHPEVYEAFHCFFQPSILASAAGNGRKDSNVLQRRAEAEVFLWRLRSLPPWLRRQACRASFVQELLLQEVASPAKCAFVMMQGLVLGALLVTFSRQMDLFVETSVDNQIAPTLASDADETIAMFEGNGDEILLSNVFAEPSLRYEAWNTLAIYVLSAFGIGFQAVFWALSGSLGEFQHLCLFSVRCWIDFFAVLGCVAAAAMIHEGVSDEHILIVASVTTGMLWCSVVGFFSTWWYGMAFFTGSIAKIVQRMLWPTLLVAICIVGFAEMIYTLAQVDCSQDFGPNSICNLRDAYQLVYFLMIGEPVIDIGSSEPLPVAMTVLLLVFLVLAFLLFLGLIVVVVIAASKSDSEAVAGAYWEPKLAFVIASQSSRVAAARYKKDMWIPRPSRMDGLVARFEETWGVSMCLLFGRDKEKYWYATDLPPLQKLCFKAALVVLLPIWLLAGLLTFGLLWPPQVRHFIFSPGRSLAGDARPNEAKEHLASQVAGVRNEVVKLKGMSYEQSNDIHQEIQQLKAMLATALSD